MTAVSEVQARPSDAHEPGAPPRQRSLFTHVLLLGLLLVGLAVTTPLDSAVTVDEGLYALQSRALADGSWELPYQFAESDPTGEWYPYRNASMTDDGGYVAITRQPAYVVVQSWLVDVIGAPVGLRALSLFGVLAAAVAAWLLAGELLGGGRVLAFWMTALSPLLFNGLLAWAHSPSAALAGFAVLGAARLVRRGPSFGTLVLLGTSLVAGVLIRSEGIIFAAGLLAAVGGFLLRANRWRAALATVPVGAAAMAAFMASRWWTAAIVGRAPRVPSASSADVGFIEGRINGAWHSLADGGTGSSAAAVLVLTAAVLAYGAARAARHEGEGRVRDLAFFTVVAGALYALRTVVAPDDFVTGLFAAWPVLILALPLPRWRHRSMPERAALTGCGLFIVGVVATQYSEGGGLEWGGRFFSPLTVPLAVTAAAGLIRVVLPRLRESSVDLRRIAGAGLIGIVAVPVVAGAIAGHRIRTAHDDVVDRIEALEAGVVVSTDGALPRIAWRAADETSWLLVDDESDLRRALRTVDAQLPERFAVFGFRDAPTVPGWHVEDLGGGLAVLSRT